jgi:predicted transposase YbfD/YdcC
MIQESFVGLRDPRVVGRTRHPLINILVIALLAVLCRSDEWDEIEMFGLARVDWLASFLILPKDHPIPSDDTFERVFGAMNQKVFAECLFKLTRALQKAVKGDTIAIDGKTLRGTCEKDGQGGLHLVSAFASELALTLGQVACAEKSNEITAIPELLELLDLRSHIVTIDAMGCQTAIVEQIRQQKGQYVIGLKGNQGSLRDDMEGLFKAAFEADFKGYKHTYHATREQGHGRDEGRSFTAIEIPVDHPQLGRWKGLKTLLTIGSTRHDEKGETWLEDRYYISSLPADSKLLAQHVRNHWGIENKVHWNLDVTFGEDSIRQRKRNATANLAAVRKLVLSMLRQETSHNMALRRKRFLCLLDPSYMIKVLLSAKF